jgi:RNA recognition motif-containing protein
MSQKCALCNLEFGNVDQFKQHLEGKRHKKLEAIREERESSARRSLFVSNLRKDTFIKQLEDHFVQFGKIVKIVTDQEKNAYAIVEYESETSVENAVNSTQEHFVNGKHLKVSRREVKEFVSKIGTTNERKKEALEKLKEEALTVNKILAKCESVGFLE